MSRRRVPLKWVWSQGFYFAHAEEGLWAIEQLRGRFHVSLDVKGTKVGRATQDMGSYPTSAKAKAAAAKAHRLFQPLLVGG